jgi:virginiamycin A acetyltransferase
MFLRALKSMMYAVGWVVTAPLWLSEKAARRVLGRDVWLSVQGQALSFLPGKTGILLRNAYYRKVLSSCPLHVCLQFGCIIAYSDVHIGHNVYFGIHSKLGLADIGDDTIVSDDVHILSGARQHSAAGLTQTFQEQPTFRERISIGRDCWIGARAVIMANVGENCLIGAGAVVTRPIPANSVAVGVPARVVQTRPPTPRATEESSLDVEQIYFAAQR